MIMMEEHILGFYLKPQKNRSCISITIKILIGLFMSIYASGLHAQRHEYVFRRYTIEDGLSQSTIYAIFQDRRGFMWFGSEDGLNRFDGLNFKIFNNEALNLHSISYSYIKAIVQGSNDFLWIGTYGGGLNSYDPKTEQFTRFRHNLHDANSLINDFVWSILEDHEQGDPILWIGTEDGLNKLSLKTGNWMRYWFEIDSSHGLKGQSIYAIHPDIDSENERLWLGTNAGLVRVHKQTGEFEHFPININEKHPIQHICIYAIYQD